MRAKQGEAILVIAHGFDRGCPTLHIVALLTLGPHLSAMDVGVAVGALVSDISKDRAGVTLSTGNALMHAA